MTPTQSTSQSSELFSGEEFTDTVERESGEAIVARSLDDIARVEERVTESLGLEPLSAEATIATDEALVHIAERTITLSPEATAEIEDVVEDAVIESAVELDHGLEFTKTPVNVLKIDGFGGDVDTVVAMFEKSHATLPSGHEAASLVARELAKLNSHPVLEGSTDTVELVPAVRTEVIESNEVFKDPVLKNETLDDPQTIAEARRKLSIPAEIKNVIVVESSQKAQDLERRAFEGPADERWRERVLGEANVESLQRDVAAHFEQDVSERKGQAAIDTLTGREKLPIMDISMDAHTQAAVEKTIAQRSAGFKEAISALTEARSAGTSLSTAECEQILIEANVWPRNHGNLLGKDSPGGTLADLYIDQTDLAEFATIDALVSELSGASVDSKDKLSKSILQLVAHTFPAGIELMHSGEADTLPAIVATDALAPRSQRMHGSGPSASGSLNGGFIHMTGPASAAMEYGNGSMLLGVPIETVMKHSPYMQLETSYTNNAYSKKLEDGSSQTYSTQYEMGGFHINNLASAPDAFKNALNAMHENIDNGVTGTSIGQGMYNNLSFAADGTQETAAGYTYPLSELSVYTADVEKVKEAAMRSPNNKDALYDATTIVVKSAASQPRMRSSYDHTDGIYGAMKLPNFDVDNPNGITVYAPIAARGVSFTEEMVGNSQHLRSIEHTLENTVPETIPRFLEELIDNGMSLEVALHSAEEAVNTKGASLVDLITSYNGGQDVFTEAHISKSDVIKALSDDAFKAGRSSQSALLAILSTSTFKQEHERPTPGTLISSEVNYDAWSNTGKFISDEDRGEWIKLLGDREFIIAPNDFAENAAALEASGYVFTDEQQRTIDEVRRAQSLRDTEPLVLPDSPFGDMAF